MSDEAPFAVGQRVRMKPQARLAHPYMMSYSGTVARLDRSTWDGKAYWRMAVKREGLSPRTGNSTYLCEDWELVPFADLSLDGTAQQLADAVKRGDAHAALALADRVMELVGGTPGTGVAS